MYATEFRSSRSEQELVNNVFGKCVTDELSQNLQWKTGGRGNDKRQGLSCLVEIDAMIGGNLDIYSVV